MTGQRFSALPRRLPMVALAALFVAMPLGLQFNPATGGLTVTDSVAHARRGADDTHIDDHGGRGRGRDDRGGHHGLGHDDSRDDDHDDHGRRGHSVDDDGDDDHRGHGKRRGGRGTGTPGGTPTVTKVESAGRSIEVSYSDGSREEIEHGRYERKNAAGRTVEERRATAADRARLSALR